jgi:cytochrome c peroxidase
MANVPAAEAVFFPLSLQPGGPFQAGLPYTFRISPATVVGDTAEMLQAVVRGRLELDATAMVAAGNVVDLAFTIPSDPGRALVAGKWKDVGRFKGPILRGLAGRAPYFHNGAAATLAEAVEFYDQRLGLHLSEQRKADLVAFLQSL